MVEWKEKGVEGQSTLTRTEHKQIKLHAITIEGFVPVEHFLRKLDRPADGSFIYDEVGEYYSHNNGWLCVDPVVPVKYLLIGFLYGIALERRIERETQVNMAYRWFLKLDLDEWAPDHSTISQNQRRRYRGKNVFCRLFEWIFGQCMEKGLVEGEILLTDSTHVKANSSFNWNIQVQAERKAGHYMDRLDVYEARECKRLKNSGAIKPQRKGQGNAERHKVEKTVSATDSDAGMLRQHRKPVGITA